MIQGKEIVSNTTWSEDKEDLLPIITSLIFKGVHTQSKDRNMDFKLFRDRKKSYRNKFVQSFQLPAQDSSKKDVSITKLPKSTHDGRSICVTHHHLKMQFVRSFVGGLSHNYNNLLMGIWGNASLMAMILENGHPIQTTLNQIESLIQNGSNLIHLIFGYIIERRTAAKRLRLNQLLQEIKDYNAMSGNEIDLNLIEISIQEISKIGNKTQLASCMTRIMDQMLTMVQLKCRLIKTQASQQLPKIEGHLKKMGLLLERGFNMIRKLDYYAETIAPKKAKVSLKSIVRRQANDAEKKHPKVSLTQNLSAAIPHIQMDARQITFALKQLIDNACDAVADKGAVHIQVDTLDTEKPLERFGLHMLSNYAVITVSDNGEGMTTATQARIFDPFFTTHRGHTKTGLGLAAAAGIIKAHGGYIQVRSRKNRGTVFKIYLMI